jgi:hypothetical protein
MVALPEVNPGGDAAEILISDIRIRKPQPRRFLSGGGGFRGAEGDRTPDLVNAIHALSQLSYSPIFFPGANIPNPHSKVNARAFLYLPRTMGMFLPVHNNHRSNT